MTDKSAAEALAREFMRRTARWGGVQTDVFWDAPVIEPIRGGVTLCGPWLDRYLDEVDVLESDPQIPTRRTHPTLTTAQRMRARDEARAKWHEEVAPDLPNPWEMANADDE